MGRKQLSLLIDRSKKDAILNEVKRLFLFHYLEDDFQQVCWNYNQIEMLFAGLFPGYRACNTEYHDLSHTTETFLATMRLIDGYNLSHPALLPQTAADLLLAALFHDTGYIQKEWDTLGTGAKYTRWHCERSKEFVKENKIILQLTDQQVERILGFIDSTNFIPLVSQNLEEESEQAAQVMVGAADLIAQMADRVYLEKLLFLYYEFREAGIEGYDTEFDIIKKTFSFYENARYHLMQALRGIHAYARVHFKERFGIDENLYLEAIESNMNYVKKIIEDASCNFRAKLQRLPG